MITTHSACHASASPCRHSSGELAARAAIAKGELNGNSSAAVATQLSGLAAAPDAKPNIATWKIVIGNESICSSR